MRPAKVLTPGLRLYSVNSGKMLFPNGRPTQLSGLLICPGRPHDLENKLTEGIFLWVFSAEQMLYT